MGNANGRDEQGNQYGSEEFVSGVVLRAPAPDVDSRLSRSPLLFSSQAPTVPLLRNGSTRLRQNSSQRSASLPTELGIPTLITWSLGGNHVSVQGSWDNWRERKALQKAYKDHSLVLVLATGIYHYSFCVDGEMRHNPHLPSEVNEKGFICNILEVTEYVPDNLAGVSEFEAPSSPDSSYTQSFLDDEDFTKDPLGIPPQLQSTMLYPETCKDTSKPKHVVLDHLLVNKTLSSPSVVALGTTHRFQAKGIEGNLIDLQQ